MMDTEQIADARKLLDEIQDGESRGFEMRYLFDAAKKALHGTLAALEQAQAERDKVDAEWLQHSEKQQNWIAHYDLCRRTAKEKLAAAEAERDAARAERDEMMDILGIGPAEDQRPRIATLEAERDRLAAALEKLGDKSNYKVNGDGEVEWYVVTDPEPYPWDFAYHTLHPEA